MQRESSAVVSDTTRPATGNGARTVRLRRSDTSVPGLRRRRHGDRFVYLRPDGGPVEDPETIQRIDALKIPPAWQEVWISPWSNGHLQAVGTDAAGRRQYLYHERWRLRRDDQKFKRMQAFAEALPQLRREIEQALRRSGLGRERVLACAVRLLDRAYLRSGGSEYTANGSFGLATLHREHVVVRNNGRIELEFPGKAGVHQRRSLVDPDAGKVLRALKARKGGDEELLAYRGRTGAWVDVRSGDVNDYIKQITGGEFTAKDFRTWHATVLAAVALAVSVPAARSEHARKRAVARAVSEVSDYLGNTPAVCRKSYVDPRVIDRYRDGRTIFVALDAIGGGAAPDEAEKWDAVEAAVLDLLDGDVPRLGRRFAWLAAAA
jgi:DNA topoisomerase IB